MSFNLAGPHVKERMMSSFFIEWNGIENINSHSRYLKERTKMTIVLGLSQLLI